MPDPHLDLYSVLLMLLVASVGPQVAPALAAYIIITVGALMGTLVALKMRAPDETPGGALSKASGALLFVFVLTAWSCGITFGASMLIQKWSGASWQWLLFPVAFGISSIGHRWLELPGLAWDLVKKGVGVIGELIARRGGQP